MSDAVQEARHSVSTVVTGIARARALDIPSATPSRRQKVMLVRRMGMIGTEWVHGVFDVRQLSRGEIRKSTAARGVPVEDKKKVRSANCFPKAPTCGEPVVTYIPTGCWWAARSLSSTSRMPRSTGVPP